MHADTTSYSFDVLPEISSNGVCVNQPSGSASRRSLFRSKTTRVLPDRPIHIPLHALADCRLVGPDPPSHELSSTHASSEVGGSGGVLHSKSALYASTSTIDSASFSTPSSNAVAASAAAIPQKVQVRMLYLVSFDWIIPIYCFHHLD